MPRKSPPFSTQNPPHSDAGGTHSASDSPRATEIAQEQIEAAQTPQEPEAYTEAAYKTGRPSLYRPEFPAQAAKLCDLGATDADLADFFKCDIRTIYRWMVTFPEFCHAVKDAKANLDARVERSLYQRAMGYTFDAVKILMPKGAQEPLYAPYREHVPPDTTAMIFWLKNRQKERWRDKTETEHSGTVTLESLVAASLGAPKAEDTEK